VIVQCLCVRLSKFSAKPSECWKRKKSANSANTEHADSSLRLGKGWREKTWF